MDFRTTILAGMVWTAAASGALAECTGRTLFRDDFEDDLTGWVDVPDKERIADGTLAFTPTPGKRWAAQIPGFSFDEERFCVDLDLSASVDTAQDGGIMFWAKSYDDYYFLIFGQNDAGTSEIGLFRQQPDKAVWYFVEPLPEVETGPGITNTLTLEVDGSVVSGSVNGTRIKRQRIQPDYEPFRIGLVGQTGATGGSVIFERLRITRPES